MTPTHLPEGQLIPQLHTPATEFIKWFFYEAISLRLKVCLHWHQFCQTKHFPNVFHDSWANLISGLDPHVTLKCYHTLKTTKTDVLSKHKMNNIIKKKTYREWALQYTHTKGLSIIFWLYFWRINNVTGKGNLNYFHPQSCISKNCLWGKKLWMPSGLRSVRVAASKQIQAEDSDLQVSHSHLPVTWPGSGGGDIREARHLLAFLPFCYDCPTGFCRVP